MNTSLSRPYDSNQSRREFIKRLGMLTLSTSALGAIVACSKKENRTGPLNFFGTGTLHIEEFWQRANTDIGVGIQFQDNGNDVGPVIAQMVASNAADLYDVGGLQGGAEAELAAAGVIIPWELEKIPNWSGVWEWIKRIQHAKVNGQQYGLPIVVNADSIIYLPDKIGTIDSYAAVFDPKLKGKTAMEDAWINSAIFTAIYLKQNNLAKILDPGNLTESELEGVMEFLIKKKRDGQFLKFWSGWQDGLSLIKSQEVYAMTGWEPIVYAAQREGVNAKYAVPREGYEGWSNDLILHRGVRDRGTFEKAHAFANWELSGYYGAMLAMMRGYVVPSDATLDALKGPMRSSILHDAKNASNPKLRFTADDLDKITETVQHVQSKFQHNGGIFWQNVRPTNYRLYEQWWSKLRSA